MRAPVPASSCGAVPVFCRGTLPPAYAVLTSEHISECRFWPDASQGWPLWPQQLVVGHSGSIEREPTLPVGPVQVQSVRCLQSTGSSVGRTHLRPLPRLARLLYGFKLGDIGGWSEDYRSSAIPGGTSSARKIFELLAPGPILSLHKVRPDCRSFLRQSSSVQAAKHSVGPAHMLGCFLWQDPRELR